jgi:hypothetical protein
VTGELWTNSMQYQYSATHTIQLFFCASAVHSRQRAGHRIVSVLISREWAQPACIAVKPMNGSNSIGASGLMHEIGSTNIKRKDASMAKIEKKLRRLELSRHFDASSERIQNGRSRVSYQIIVWSAVV